jgi:hypothetical protein
VLSTPSEVGSSFSAASSQYFKKRYNPSQTTRREALEQRFGRVRGSSTSPKATTPMANAAQAIVLSAFGGGVVGESSSETSNPRRGRSSSSGPQIPDATCLSSSRQEDDAHRQQYRLPTRLAPKVTSSSSLSESKTDIMMGHFALDNDTRTNNSYPLLNCSADNASSPSPSQSTGASVTQETVTTTTTSNEQSTAALPSLTCFAQEEQKRTPRTARDVKGGDQHAESRRECTKPQHLPQQQQILLPSQPESPSRNELRYYRIVYRGVVALLSEPSTTAKRSGAYVSYGEIISSSMEMEVDDITVAASPTLPTSPVAPSETGLERLGSTVHSPVLSQAWQQMPERQTQPEDDFESPSKSVWSHAASTFSKLETPRRSSNSNRARAIDQSTPRSLNIIKRKAIRVDKVLTGGYAIDAGDPSHGVETFDQTPRHQNTLSHNNSMMQVVGPSPLPMADSRSTINATTPNEQIASRFEGPHCHGFLFDSRNLVTIVESLESVPICESGSFLYKVVSSTPLQILTGPCTDAPKTKAMLLPGTVHEVCLRVSSTTSYDEKTQEHHPVYFLRLSRRRGWVADHRVTSRRSGQFQNCMKEVTQELLACNGTIGDDCNMSVLSAATSSVATPVSVARRRHRPPRRRRDGKDGGMDHTGLPRHVGGPSTPQLMRYETPTAFESPLTSTLPDRGVMSPSSNVSLLSDEASLEHGLPQHLTYKTTAGALTPDRSVSRSAASSAVLSHPSFYLMRVNAPRGLKILDAPHFQVNNLIRGNNPVASNASSPPGLGSKDLTGQMGNQSIFQTMAGHHTTTLTSKIGNPAVFDSITKARKLPRGSVFESSKRMESSGDFCQGAGLLKLSDNSGWAIVPRQDELDEQYKNYHGALAGIKEGEATRAFEEVGNAWIDDRRTPVYLRVLSRGGVSVLLPPPSSTVSDDDNTSPTSSAAGSSIVSAVGSGFGQLTSQESDVTSSVGSSFLDAMFRTPKKLESEHDNRKEAGTQHHQPPRNPTGPAIEKLPFSTVVPCGMCIEVEPWIDDSDPAHPNSQRHEFTRLRGGQGWVPRFVNGKQMLEAVSPPEFRFGSFWFRVQAQTGLKVRLGPSKRAPSIKSDDGVYFRFECGEFLRASEIMTVFRRGAPYESFAKLYRNRHTRLHTGHGEVRQLTSLTVQSEWVHVFGNDELYLEECATEPRIERHRQGWRYNVVLDTRVSVRIGPSFAAETNGMVLLGGESVLINERVTGPGETITWLRLKDGQGWVHNVGRNGESLMIPHSLKHRRLAHPTDRPKKPGQDHHDDIAYNTIIARLFHSDLPDDTYSSSQAIRRMQQR